MAPLCLRAVPPSESPLSFDQPRHHRAARDNSMSHTLAAEGGGRCTPSGAGARSSALCASTTFGLTFVTHTSVRWGGKVYAINQP